MPKIRKQRMNRRKIWKKMIKASNKQRKDKTKRNDKKGWQINIGISQKKTDTEWRENSIYYGTESESIFLCEKKNEIEPFQAGEKLWKQLQENMPDVRIDQY